MKLFFDEAGHTGSVMPNKNHELYNDNQRHFVLAGVFVQDEKDEQELISRYSKFRAEFGFDKEKKGSDLMTKDNNDALSYFIENVLDSKHFWICNYDKIFYLSTLICMYIFGPDFRNKEPLVWYQYASALAGEKPELFLKYCELVKNHSEEESRKFLKYLINFPFVKMDRDDRNLLIIFSKLMLSEKEIERIPLGFDAYIDGKYSNIVNITALGELLLCLKHIYNIDLDKCEVIHDHIKEYENDYIDSFSAQNIEIHFRDSKEDLLIQLADNVASIYRKSFEKSFEAFQKGKQWTENVWFTEIYASFIEKISLAHVKHSTPISDWALPYAIQEIFGTNGKKSMRNDKYFMKLFYQCRYFIEGEISKTRYDVDF